MYSVVRDEVGLAGGNDPGNRGGFPWDEARWDVGLRDSVRALLHLHAREAGLCDGPVRVVGADGSAVAFERGVGAEGLVVAVNAGDSAVRLGLSLAGAADGGGGGRLAAVELPGFAQPATVGIVGGAASIEDKSSGTRARALASAIMYSA
jgi:hypothetical protein